MADEPQQMNGGAPVSTTETTNASMLNQVVGKLVETASSSSTAVITALTSIASAVTASLIGGTTGSTVDRVLVAKGTTGRALQPSGASADSSGNINTNGGDLIVDDITADDIAAQDINATTSLTKNGANLALAAQAVGIWSGTFKAPENETVYLILNVPAGVAVTITQTNVITEVGTATVTVSNNGTPINANSASTSLNTVAQSSAVSTSSYVAVTFSSTSSDCENLCLTIWGTQVLAS